ncbi:CPA1 family monovalent cation:H+ antiporter [Rubrivivax gelatinosus]|uniref:cation:proton antiporter n=2 Tax=Rubrivivax gelatinosus TaxID=28068 RepID=UPI0018C964D1|nr:cation:proton antiporter [Rubrivivax gelatinosus]MBG6082855.1 CPA1 family monovalent cation:H+ antiporter [Rubrivivax gelatinosus]
MAAFEQVLLLFLAAVVLAAAARRVGAPYPVFLAIGGALLAFVPGAPQLSLPPELVLALFVAPVLVDAGFDASLRDLRDNWGPLLGLVVVAIGLTTAAVALVVHALAPGVPWAAAVALGALVAPPDAVAATAVLRPLRPPQRLLSILEGESLLNDASALLIYRLAVGAVAAGGFSVQAVAPTFLLGVAGSLVAGPVLGWLVQRALERVQHIPTSIILTFLGAIGVWLFAERVGLSGVLTTVCFAMTLSRTAPARVPARVRLPTNAVWATVVFALNIFAFIFIGLQIRPILVELAPALREQYLTVGAAVLATVIGVRIAWQMSFNAVLRWRDRRFGFRPPRPMLQPTAGSGLVIAWAGMRGIVTLAAALALPEGFPARDMIVLTAFLVVLGTLLLQGLTLGPLLCALKLDDGDPVAHEERLARERLLQAACRHLPAGGSPAVDLVRHELTIRLGQMHLRDGPNAAFGAECDTAYRSALRAARAALLTLRHSGEIGDDAFHRLENDLDWMEVSDPLRAANADATE